MAKHLWKVDLAGDFDATEAEGEALDAGVEAIAEIASLYEKRFDEFLSSGDEIPSLARTAEAGAVKRGDSLHRAAAVALFARTGHVAQAVGSLPRKKIGYEDFEKMPIVERGEITPGWHRMMFAGRWVIGGPTVAQIARNLGMPVPPIGLYMIYRAEIVDGPDKSRN